MPPLNAKRLLTANSGQSLVETALTLSLLTLLLAAAVDFGRAYYMLIELKGAAHAGAIYGSQYPTDNAGMQNIAKSNAADLTSSSGANFSATADWGCACSDGTNSTAESGGACATPSCSGLNEIYYVTVTTTASYSPLLPWPGIPSSMNLSETVKMRSANY